MAKVLFRKPYPPCDETQTVTGLTASYPYWNQARLSWNAIPGISEYQVWEQYSTNSWFVQDTKFDVTNLGAPGVSYSWGVRPRCSGVNGDWTFSNYAAPSCTSETITNLQASNVTNSTALITWDVIPGIIGYAIWDSDSTNYVGWVGENQNSYNLEVTPGAQNVDIGVRATCSTGPNASNYSNYSWINDLDFN